MDDLNDIERDLRRLVPRPAPPGLGERVLDSALGARKNTALTSRMRIVAVVCMVLIVALLGLDPLIGRHESARLAALLDGRPSGGAQGAEAFDLAESLGGQGYEGNGMAKLQARIANAVRKERQRHFGEALRGLRGWSVHEIYEDLN